jgi:hypothetical protein
MFSQKFCAVLDLQTPYSTEIKRPLFLVTIPRCIPELAHLRNFTYTYQRPVGIQPMKFQNINTMIQILQLKRWISTTRCSFNSAEHDSNTNRPRTVLHRSSSLTHWIRGQHEASLVHFLNCTKLTGITTILHAAYNLHSVNPPSVVYDAEFAFNDLTNSRARVGLYKLRAYQYTVVSGARADWS